MVYAGFRGLRAPMTAPGPYNPSGYTANPGGGTGGGIPPHILAALRARGIDPSWVDAGMGAGSAAAPPSAWTPGEFNRPRTPYPVSRYAGTPGGSRGRVASSGGGGGFGGGVVSGHAFNPTASMGPGAYYPGGNAEFNSQQQRAILGIMGGNVAPDTRQPAQVLASMMRGTLGGRGNPLARGLMGGGMGGSSGGLAGDFQSAFDEARMENEARYRDILEGHQAGRDMLVGMGAQEAADINEAYYAQGAARNQDLVGRGLGNSTIVDTMQMGNERERNEAQGRLQERLRREHYAALQDQLGFMERRNDTYPDFTQLERLARAEGEAGIGQLGGAGSGAPTHALAITPTFGFGPAAPTPVVSYARVPRMPHLTRADYERILAMNEARRREALLKAAAA